eukprot:jgi/Psemu1/20956/gm1.20956_g
MKQNITWYVKETMFRKIKFPPELVFVQLMIERIVKLGKKNGIPKTMKMSMIKSGVEFSAKQSLQVGTMLKLLPGKTTKVRTGNIMVANDKRNNWIPDNFPATVLITDTRNMNSENRKAFQATISYIFTPSNEAFALFFLYNDYDLWLNATKGTGRERNSLTEQQSSNLEMELLKTYQPQNGNHTPQDVEEEESEKEQRWKEQCNMIETLGKDDKDYKYYVEYMKPLQK